MNIRMNGDKIIAGPDVARNDDGTYTLPARQGAAIVRAGLASTSEPLPPEPETADEPDAGETAALKSKGKRA